MRKPETITMTMRELDRLKVIQAVVDHGLGELVHIDGGDA
ncbi:hypothetical protein CBM2586_B90431 [Cupriavidus phytorum]|uniref:Uncharacterized protein n=2 Tax=Cupriavidus TaxID=106589 RepID=A0A976ACK4_9BURK|nr:hypothetical protein C7416_116109 [Cupriavidus alkaliphilus]SOY76545.1 hypothetical protein CBM2586_B90431 [Cupriavidus taiwanensis]